VVGPPVSVIKAPHFVFQVRNQLAQILGGDESAVTRGGWTSGPAAKPGAVPGAGSTQCRDRSKG